MVPVANILKEYRNADADVRLELFLAYRDLRDRFTAIDAGDEAGRAPQLPSFHLEKAHGFFPKRQVR
jgi:hypothetical protein